MLQALLIERFHLLTRASSSDRAVYALATTKAGVTLSPAVTPPPEPDETSAPIAFYGGTIDRRIANAVTILSNPRMGEVRQTEQPDGRQRWEAENITLAGIADLIDKVAPLPLPVVDRTGIQGRYRMILEVAAFANDPLVKENPRMELEASVLRAFNNGLRRLGLQLERSKAPVDTLVVDRAEILPAAN